ncbi:proline--tRNA ligase [Nitrospirales bacterium NOB]|nr:Proline--tRNA ligase [Nitrospirota bacterium]MCE7965916.1 proline--tRNA ligase [Nitrospira sp. NTP2]MDL1888464.1 proline--tRNA ligase [Nitrospirales bacterium NOB]MEB2339564.1 proline--tRNA ligase [Nitrospirales bacterium]RIK60344.1 MAG: proline--tRNA ligase [Nitrospira sp.]
MRVSETLIPTLREDPGEAETVSHRFMLRAGMIRKVAAGIYTYLPLGLRVLRKIECIVREEMNRAGAQEVLMPVASPAELWRETGRWDFYGKELLRFKDRHERDFCLGPTHEEVITDLFRREVRSYRQMPLNFYQIQTKFRDEIRPRFGLMRGREFIMKDAYSFDRDEAAAKLSYQKMYEAYNRIFTRCGLTFRPVEADTGLIGGTSSHEFMVLAETGEETIVYSEQGTYAANVERAEVLPPEASNEETRRPLTAVKTPNRRTVEDVTAFLKITPQQLVKTLLYDTGIEAVAVLVRGDHEVNEIKLKRLLGVTDVELVKPERVPSLTGAPAGFVGPVGLKQIRILADWTVQSMANFVVGANQADTHFFDANWDRDFTVAQFADLRNAQAGDASPRKDGILKTAKGIEVGHVFMLGTKYSQAMKATFLDAQGQEQFAVMGCYGIGVSRVAAAAVEQNHDAKGIKWPLPIAPFHVTLLPLSQSEPVTQLAGQLYQSLQQAGIEVLWDDREERAGVKFNDADLIGAPYHLVIGDKGLAQGQVELKRRQTGETIKTAPDQVLATLSAWITDAT